MNLVIPANYLGQVISGNLTYQVTGSKHGHKWNRYFFSPPVSITIIPHALSMLPIPIQDATGNEPFIYNLKTAVKFYDENVLAGKPAQAIVTPVSQDGLYFDAASLSIQGKPTRLGSYVFTVSAQNEYSKAEAVPFKIEVHANLKERPVFKTHYSMASALPKQQYRMNLMELLQPQLTFMDTNQISFRIMSDVNTPTWLHIAPDDATLLVGDVPESLAGEDLEIKLIAASNTGGDSEPKLIKIPIAYDPARKPAIEYFKLKFLADSQINQDLVNHVNARGDDAHLKIILDKVEPPARWLHMSLVNLTHLEGMIPTEAVGQLYQLTFRANTVAGGSSEPVTIPLQIAINEQFTPRFKAANPNLALAQINQPYFYDFKENKDIFPDFGDIPYEISFASEWNHPLWLRLEHNQLVADNVPKDIEFPLIIDVIIKNIPGGASQPISLVLAGNN